jgi:hypothetical protein
LACRRKNKTGRAIVASTSEALPYSLFCFAENVKIMKLIHPLFALQDIATDQASIQVKLCNMSA